MTEPETMSEADCDRMERAAMHVEAANALCLRASEEIDYLKQIILALLNRDITYHDTVAHLPFESHDQAINHIAEARRAAADAPIE